MSVLFVREWLKMTKEPSRLMGIVAQPLLFWIVIGGGFMPSFRIAENSSLGYQDFFFVGVVAMVVLFSAIFGTITLIDDKASGFMQAVLVAPGSRWALVLGKISGVASVAVLQALLIVGVGAALGVSLSEAAWLQVFGFLALGAIALGGMGFVFAWGTSSSAAYHALMGIVMIPMWIVSGGMFPPDTPWMQWIVLVNPVAWLVAGLRAAFAGGVAPLGSVTGALTPEYCLAGLVIFSLIMIVLGARLCAKN